MTNRPEAPSPAPLDRRGFLKLGGGASAGAAAAAAGVVAASPALAVENDSDRRKARYRETDHVKNFYRVNRY